MGPSLSPRRAERADLASGFEAGEEGAGGLQIGGVEAFGEPGVNRGEEGDRLLRPTLLAAQAGEAHRGAQFPGLCVLPARDGDGLLQSCLSVACRPGAASKASPLSR
jgi:hypothetical protein